MRPDIVEPIKITNRAMFKAKILLSPAKAKLAMKWLIVNPTPARQEIPII